MTIAIILVVLVALYLFCISPRICKKADRTPFYGVHYAHRGLFDNTIQAPENSLPAFRKAVEAGYGIELDIQLTKDDIPVVFHDASLKRVCGVEGKIWDYTWEELQKLKLYQSEEKIPTLAQVLQVVDGKVPLIIEYKMDRVTVKVCELAEQLLKNYKGAYCIESFHPFAVLWYRKHRPDVVRGQLSEDFLKEPEQVGKMVSILMTYLLVNVVGRPDFISYRHTHAKNLSRRICKWMGALSVAWTIQSKEEMEQVKEEFDLFIFDSCRL